MLVQERNGVFDDREEVGRLRRFEWRSCGHLWDDKQMEIDAQAQGGRGIESGTESPKDIEAGEAHGWTTVMVVVAESW